MAVITPVLPGFVLVCRITRDNKKSIENLNHMRKKLEEIIEKLKDKKQYLESQINSDVRSLQDMIFENRYRSPLIPDKFYFRYRDKFESVSLISNKDLINIIRSNNISSDEAEK